MFKNQNLAQLIRLSKESSKKLNLELAILDETFGETLKGAPETDKSEIEKLRGMSQRAIALAKAGKTEEANAVIKQYQDGSKSNR